MKANELRIGNYIEFNNSIDVKIIAINIEFISFWKDDNFNFIFNSKNQFNPIPLTEEWLLKFGFNNDIKINLYQFQDLSIVWPSENFFLNTWKDELVYGVEKIKYVHQLQNLYFALTGDELISE